MYIPGSVMHPAKSAEALMKLFEMGSKNRHVASTSEFLPVYLLHMKVSQYQVCRFYKLLHMSDCLPISTILLYISYGFLMYISSSLFSRDECRKLKIPSCDWNSD